MTHQKEQAANNATKAVWGTNPAGWTHASDKQVGTQEFFEEVLRKRFSEECSWLPNLVKFEEYAYKKVLEIGCGGGYDAYQFCKNKAYYMGIDLVPENIKRTKNHLSFYGYFPALLEMDAARMTFSTQFDLIYSFGVLHHIFDIQKVLAKSYEYLQDNGKICFIVYHKNSIFYWLHVGLVNWILKGKFLKESLGTTLARIETVGSEELPLVRVYSKKEFSKLVTDAGFTVTDVQIRKLNKEDLPPFRFIWRFYKYVPQHFLDRYANWWGWYLCVEAAKKVN